MWFIFGISRILDMENKFLWKADEHRTKNSNLRKFTDKISKKYRIDFKNSFLELYKWSIKILKIFGVIAGIIHKLSVLKAKK